MFHKIFRLIFESNRCCMHEVEDGGRFARVNKEVVFVDGRKVWVVQRARGRDFIEGIFAEHL